MAITYVIETKSQSVCGLVMFADVRSLFGKQLQAESEEAWRLGRCVWLAIVRYHRHAILVYWMPTPTMRGAFPGSTPIYEIRAQRAHAVEKWLHTAHRAKMEVSAKFQSPVHTQVGDSFFRSADAVV